MLYNGPLNSLSRDRANMLTMGQFCNVLLAIDKAHTIPHKAGNVDQA